MKVKYIVFLLLLINSCSKSTDDSLVNNKIDVNIKKTDVIGETKVLVTGAIVKEDNNTLQKVGFCWNTSVNPTVVNDTVNATLNNGEFSLEINGLTPNTTYYIRAFAYSKTDIIYSGQITFTTKNIKILSEATYRYAMNYEERAIAAKKTSDGGFVVTGWINPYFGLMDGDVVVLKYNQNLELQWSNIIKERAKNEFPVSMVVDSEDNIVILANVDASSSLIKINSQGNLLWRKAFDENKHYKLNALIETKDGQYAMVGYCLKNFGTHELEADRVFVKTNRNGEIRLEKNYGNVYTQGGAKALVEDKVGNFILMGDCTDQSSTIDMTLNKVDNQGNAIWRKNVIRKGDDWGISIIKSNDNNIIISGTTDSFGPGQTNIWLLKLDWDANIIFEKAIGKASHLIESDEAIGLIESENGDILVANTIGGPKLDPPMESDMYVIRTDAGGNLLWDKKFGISKYYYWDSAHSLLELNPGEIVVAGRKQDIETTIIDDMRSDLWIIKINGN